MNDIIRDLRFLKKIRASENLHERIQTMTWDLPISERLSVFPLFYTARIALAVVLLFAFLGSGMVLAAYNSNSNSPLFPIKKAIVKAQLQFVKNPVAREQLQKEIAEPTPTPIIPTPTEKPEPSKELEGKPSVEVLPKEIKQDTESILEKNNERTSTPSAILGAQTKKNEGKDHTQFILLTPEPTISLLPKTTNED